MERTIEEILPSTGYFNVKLTAGKITVKPYLIIDRKEVHISTRKNHIRLTMHTMDKQQEHNQHLRRKL